MAKDGRSCAAGRMFKENSTCTYELLTSISLERACGQVGERLMEYHQEFFWNDKARIVSGGEIVKVSSLGLREKDGLELIAPLHRH
ncbi:hypothetical protein [Bradyrhizobium icense]|uniref:hypothetical protein n=1 Tax=Bradyrhizobium icense TaxID=1274631 RepID=UPI0012E9F7C0|nr:hypothetical protein [Bradyrhizobium icense]